MKKVYKMAGIGLVLCVLCFYIYYTFPRTVNLSYEGIKYTIGDGIMVSAPAKNRVEALEISNKLMRNVLKYRLE